MTVLTFGKNAGLFHTCHRMSCVAAIEADGLQCGSFGYRTFYLEANRKCSAANLHKLMKGDYMTFLIRNCLFAVNIIVPLVFGLFIYLTKTERTYISDFLSGLRSALPVIYYPDIIRNYASDFLWTYSMFFCIRLTLGDELKGKHSLTVMVLTGVVAIILESVQLIEVVPGTFDLLDIVAEFIAIAVAYLITLILERRFNYYEKKSIN